MDNVSSVMSDSQREDQRQKGSAGHAQNRQQAEMKLKQAEQSGNPLSIAQAKAQLDNMPKQFTAEDIAELNEDHSEKSDKRSKHKAPTDESKKGS